MRIIFFLFIFVFCSYPALAVLGVFGNVTIHNNYTTGTTIPNATLWSMFANITQIMNNDTILNLVNSSSLLMNYSGIITGGDGYPMNNQTIANAIDNNSIIRNDTEVKFRQVNASGLNISGSMIVSGSTDDKKQITIRDTTVVKQPGINFRVDTTDLYQIYADNNDSNTFKIAAGSTNLLRSYQGGVESMLMSTAYPSYVGTSGDAWIGYVKNDNQWFIGSFAGDIAYRNTGGRLIFGATTGSNTPHMVINSSGSIGIGTNNPNSKLQVNGTKALFNVSNNSNSLLYVTDQSGGMTTVHNRLGVNLNYTPATILDIRSRNAAPSGTPTVAVRIADGGGWAGFINERTDGQEFQRVAVGTSTAQVSASSTLTRMDLGFETWANRYAETAISIPVISLLPSGNVGIGIINPTVDLDVNGSTYLRTNLTVAERATFGTTTASTLYPFYFTRTDSKSSGSNYMVYNYYLANNTINSSTAYYYGVGNYLYTHTQNTNNISLMVGIENRVSHNSLGHIANAWGMQNTVMLQKNGTIANAYGTTGTVQIYGNGVSGNITHAYAGYFQNNVQGDNAYMTDSYGIFIKDTVKDPGNTVTNAKGLYIEDIDSGNTSNYAIHTNDGFVYFGDNVKALGTINSTYGFFVNSSPACTPQNGLCNRTTSAGNSNETLWGMFANITQIMNNVTIANAIFNSTILRNQSSALFQNIYFQDGYGVTLCETSGCNMGGAGSIAIGRYTDSTGSNSISIGESAFANNTAGIAIGDSVLAHGYGSINIGWNVLDNRNSYCTNIGTYSKCLGGNSVALGAFAIANSAYALAMNYGSFAGANSIAIGDRSNATNKAMAFGSYAQSIGPTGGIAIGYATNTTQSYSIAVGYMLSNNVANSTMIGNDVYLHDDLFMNGKLAIGGSSTIYPLYVKGNESSSNISAVIDGRIIAHDYLTKTSVYDNSKGMALDYIKDSSDYIKSGKINHAAFYGYDIKQLNKTDYTQPVLIQHKETHCNDIECWNISYSETTYPYSYLETEETVSLNEEINVLRQAVYELKLELCTIKPTSVICG